MVNSLNSIKKERDSRLEALRIFCILIITLHHAFYHSDVMEQTMSVNRILAQLFLLGGKLGVNIFILISGYFGCIKVNGFSKRILNTIATVFCYTLGILALSCIFNPEALTFKRIVKSVFPISFEAYWFITAYIGLQLLSPWLNKLIGKITFKEYRNLLIVLTVMLSVLPTLRTKQICGNYLMWFVFLYLIAGFIRKYKDKFLEKENVENIRIKKLRKIAGVAFASSIGIMWGLSVAFYYVGNNPYISFLSKFKKLTSYFALHMENVFMLVASVSAFCFVLFMKLLPKSFNKIINAIGKNVLGAYLIQSNTFISSYLWKFVHSNADFNSAVYIPKIIAFCIAIVLCGIAVNLCILPLIQFFGKSKPLVLIDKKLSCVLN